MHAMLITTILSFIIIVGGCVLWNHLETGSARHLRTAVRSNGFGCGVILWLIVAFWAWVIFGVVQLVS